MYFLYSTSEVVGLKSINGEYKKTSFKTSKFKAKIDFNKRTFVTNDLKLTDNACASIFTHGITCVNDRYLININKHDFKFVLSKAYAYVIRRNNIVIISIGKCKKF